MKINRLLSGFADTHRNIYCNSLATPQIGITGGDRRRLPHLHPGHFLSIRVPVPSPAKSDSAFEEPTAEDQGQKQTGRLSPVLRLQDAQKQDCPHFIALHGNLVRG